MFVVQSVGFVVTVNIQMWYIQMGNSRYQDQKAAAHGVTDGAVHLGELAVECIP